MRLKKTEIPVATVASQDEKSQGQGAFEQPVNGKSIESSAIKEANDANSTAAVSREHQRANAYLAKLGA